MNLNDVFQEMYSAARGAYDQTKSNYENPGNVLINQLFGSIMNPGKEYLQDDFGQVLMGPDGQPLYNTNGGDTGDILAVLKFLQGDSGGSGGGSGAAYAQVQLGYAQLAQREAEASADELYKKALISLQQGDQDLARQQFSASEEQRGIANDMQNKVFEYTKGQDATQNALSAYGQMENSALGRGNLSARGGEGMSTVASNYATALGEQQRLALEQLKTPRNAIASFLIGQGMGVDDATSAQGKFNPKNLMGLDAGALPGMFQQAFSAAQGTNQGQNIAPPTTAPDIAGFLNALKGFAGTPETTGNPVADGMNRPPVFERNQAGNYYMAPNQSAFTNEGGTWKGPVNQEVLKRVNQAGS